MRQLPHFRIKIKSFLGFKLRFLSSAGSADGGAHQRNAADVVFSADVADGADVVFIDTLVVVVLALYTEIALILLNPVLCSSTFTNTEIEHSMTTDIK